eukprot:TRINITY_DN53298_c0_g1_i1.p1 TRINITY_DN53298_c0_g1~~TRINITY_DN53298_c0_g1_i1.p1  ORF type:complete len:302 (+),score=51.08 TRINITY_DN53298_c0_g1_i1:32-937(+)
MTDVVRSLHWVLKVGNLKKSVQFYSKVFGIRILRHEEFSSGCEATCNGPYSRPWSKTMVGYGEETGNFALELTYNYGIKKYKKGNDLRYIALRANPIDDAHKPFRLAQMKAAAKDLGYAVNETGEGVFVVGPDDCQYKLVDTTADEPFVFVSINVKDIEASKAYWVGMLGMKEYSDVPGAATGGKSCVLGFGDEQAKLELVETGAEIDHADAFGRIAFSTRNGPKPIYQKIVDAGLKERVQNEPITLPTPGKADVEVTILTDVDGYEICFVGEKGFNDLCALKPGVDYVDWEARAENGADR